MTIIEQKTLEVPEVQNEEKKGNGKAELYKAYIKATNEIKNPANVAENPFHNSKYAPLSEIIEVAKPILAKYGLATMQIPFINYEKIQDNKGNERQIAVVGVTTSLVHVSGEVLEFPPMVMKVGNINPQAIGSTITYCRRYSLSSILGIAGREEDDDGNIALMGQQEIHEQVPNHNNYPINNQNNEKANQQPVQQSQEAKNKKPSSQISSNVELVTVTAKVMNKKEGVSGKGTPYFELVLANEEGEEISVIAKDDAYEGAKALENEQVANFKILNANGFKFVKQIEVGAKNE